MRVLIGFSRCPITVTILRGMGIEAWTCDLRQADHAWHIQGDIWDVADASWDWGIFHPMCTYLTCSAAWAFSDPDFNRYPGVGYHQRVRPGTLTGAAAGLGFVSATVNGRDDTRGVNWSTSDPTVATVSKNGVVKYIGAGTAELIATLPNTPVLTTQSVSVTVS